MDIRDLDRRAGAVLGEVVMQVRPEHLWFPTPCPDWTVRGLMRHLVSQNEGLAAAALNGSASVHVWTGGRLGDNPAGAYRRSNVRVADAFADGGALDRLVEVREFGSFPRRIALTFHQLDCVVHAWDLARAIDVPYNPPPDMVDLALTLARRIPDTDANRGTGYAFERSVKVSGTAPDLDQLLGLLGRNPEWVSPLD
ncbi:TIGR03086 family metal-binding protein [Kribbella sindirgiensis]|uniref:TIGR03086 family protein n=1 Tax=Kribbella sindirgiensis TaxID=1124744 RepID=A0A4R0ITZ8_9ACTN|nr:TIGR03086 family metal-binding protein [Kribbella sindirgiensis]TCC36729.1 TIGR03086 family protein [Kribbella sindirgiensis]